MLDDAGKFAICIYLRLSVFIPEALLVKNLNTLDGRPKMHTSDIIGDLWQSSSPLKSNHIAAYFATTRHVVKQT